MYLLTNVFPGASSILGWLSSVRLSGYGLIEDKHVRVLLRMDTSQPVAKLRPETSG